MHPVLLASIDRLARAANWSVAHTSNLLATLPVLEPTVRKLAVRAEPLVAMLGACAANENVVVSTSALKCGVHGFVANVNLLVPSTRRFLVRIPGLIASIDRLARAVNALVAHTANLLVALPVLEAAACEFVVAAEFSMAMLDAFAVGETVAVSMVALVCGVHGFVANVNMLVR